MCLGVFPLPNLFFWTLCLCDSDRTSPPLLPSLPPPPPFQEQKPETGVTGIDWAGKKAEASKAAKETAEYVKVSF